VPMGRLGTSEELQGVCIFLASSASDFMTGQTVYVDGGRSCKA
jgi:gluconate 5-dehydrogenase